MEAHAQPEDGREDDGRVAEDHAEDEAEQDRVQHGVVRGSRPQHAVGEGDDATDHEPAIAGQQADRHEAWQSRAADGEPGDVVAKEPRGEAQHGQPADSDAEVGIERDQRHRADVGGHDKAEGPHRAPAQPTDPRELEPFADDGQHQEGHPPVDEQRDRPPGQPGGIRHEQEDGADGHDADIERRLAPDHLEIGA